MPFQTRLGLTFVNHPRLRRIEGRGAVGAVFMIFPPDLRTFVDTQLWTFAKTMPEWPHEYILRDRVDEELFERLVVHILEHGVEGRF
jgi:hypothetical protein